MEASKLRKRLGTYYMDAGANDPIVIELVGGSYMPRIGTRGHETKPSRLSCAIAVLPLVNLAPEPDMEYLADGLTEEIIDRMGKVPGSVLWPGHPHSGSRGRAGTFSISGVHWAHNNLIEGSVRKHHSLFRVNAPLIDAATGYQLWSHAYDEPFHDVSVLRQRL